MAEPLQPPVFPTVLAGFAAAARRRDGRGVTLVPPEDDAPETHRSWTDLHADSERMARGLAARGVTTGDRILLLLPTSLEFVAAFFAVQRLGAIPIPSNPPALFESPELALVRARHVAAHAGVTVCITTPGLVPLLGAVVAHLPRLSIVTVEKLLASSGDGALPAAPEAGPALVQYTSGSTGHPKGVLLSHEALAAQAQGLGQIFSPRPDDVTVCWLPLTHDMGLIGGLLRAAWFAESIVLMAPATFLLRPARWLQAIHRHRGTITAAPNFAYALCLRRVSEAERRGLDLSSMRLSLNGAETVHLPTIERFQQMYGPLGFKPEAMRPVYGLAEASLGVTLPRGPVAPLAVSVDRAALAEGVVRRVAAGEGTALVWLGTPFPGTDVRIDAPAGQVGEVLVRGPSVMTGYFRDAAATAEVLRDGWLHTGDLGFFDDDGGLCLSGRAKDLVIVRGRKYPAEELERVVEQVEGVRPGCSVAFGSWDEARGVERVVILCETRQNEDEARSGIVERVREAVSQACGVAADEVVLLPPRTLPKTTSGKRQRALARDRHLRGELSRIRRPWVERLRVIAGSGRGYLSVLRRRIMHPTSHSGRIERERR